ncbi:hypothetical protein ACFYPN_19070 [Streptomyces sp. NPDC005576]|uniref:hypothetical protein n=1 Tax=Streptomyces sp. NPDC005576 TaxID=3364726 RepID=UPI0036B8C840
MAPGPPPSRSPWLSRSLACLLLATLTAVPMQTAGGAGGAASASPRTDATAAVPSVPPVSRAPAAHLPYRAPPAPPAPSTRHSPGVEPPPGWPSPDFYAPASGRPASAASAPAGGVDASISTGPTTITPPADPLVPPSVHRSGRPSVGPSSSLDPSGNPSASPSTRPSEGGAPFAGRPAGEGRVRPGRSLTPEELASAVAALEDDEAVPPPAPVSTAPPFPPSEPVPANRQYALSVRGAERLHGLSLGGGITLVGLGLLFLGVRMRRAD